MPRLQLSCLPSVQVVVVDQPLSAFRTLNERALLVYLAVEHERPHPRETLAGLLWPDAPESVARRNLNQALLNLRASLGDRDAAQPFLLATRQTLQLNPAADIFVDVNAIAAHLAFVERHSHTDASGCAACMERLREAVGHYRGAFLREFARVGSELFEEWALLKREWLERRIIAALGQPADYELERGEGALAERYARRALELDPLDEAAHRRLMRILAASGQRSAALLHYSACQKLLAAELGVEPYEETRALYERISAEDVPRSPRDSAAPPHNLPASLSAFVGREAELAELAALRAQPDVRLLTLIGAGGMGKTRLALEFARASLGAYADGVFFVPLASLAAASELPAAIAQALDVSLHGDPATALLRLLRNKEMLLILDNFEHLLEGAELVLALLHEAPQVKIIATSRARLNVRGEQIYLVQGLHYAAEATQGAAASSAAVRLFAQAGRRGQPTFQVSQANLAAVLRICPLVHGMPLGLELAAAWTEMLSLDEIASEIERSADFLSADWLDAPARQRSMRAVFDWSWRLLNAGEQQVLRRLALFRGGFTREAAEKVAEASLRALTTLVQKSLLRRADGGALSTGRYELHELLRQFAAEQLDAVGERAAVEARHSQFYLSYVAQRERHLARGHPRQASDEMRSELDNIRQA